MITSARPELSIITVNYYSEDSLGRCLASLEADPLPVEVIVADNGSVAHSRQALEIRFPAVRWAAMGSNLGFGAASNAGARLASAPSLLFLNPDAELCGGNLAEVLDALHSPALAGSLVGLRILDPGGTTQLSCRRFPTWTAFLGNRGSLLTRFFPRNPLSRSYLMTDFEHLATRRVDWVSGAAFAVEARVFAQLSGFDERYFLYCEDIDLCKRAAARGIATWFHPAPSFRHLIGGSSRHCSLIALYHRHRSIWRYYRTHLRFRPFDPLVAALLGARYLLLCSASILARGGAQGGEA